MVDKARATQDYEPEERVVFADLEALKVVSDPRPIRVQETR